jgi:hypothetical protein
MEGRTIRLNIYAEELTDEVEVTTKTVFDAKFGERTFYGVRLFLKSPEELHADPADDDRSAITFWVKWTAADGTDPTILLSALANMALVTNKEVP